MDPVRVGGYASGRQIQALREAAAANSRADRLARESDSAQREAEQLLRRADRLQEQSAQARAQAISARRDGDRPRPSREPDEVVAVSTTSLANSLTPQPAQFVATASRGGIASYLESSSGASAASVNLTA